MTFSFRSHELPPGYLSTWGDRTHALPLIVDGPLIRQLSDDLHTLFRLAIDLPYRLFSGDLRAFCRALGMSQDRSDFLAAIEERPVHFGRADFYITPDGEAKLLEWNLASDLGGTDRSELNRAMEVPPWASYVHTGEAIVAAWGEHSHRAVSSVAIVCAPGELAKLGHLVAPVAEMLERLGVRTVLGELGDLEFREGRVLVSEDSIDMVWRFFHVDHLLSDDCARDIWDELYSAYRRGEVEIWTLPNSSLLSSKALLPMLASEAIADVSTPEEQETVRRLLARSWELLGPPTALPRAQSELVLKPALALAGEGVILGSETDESDWQSALSQVGDRTHILQERVLPRPEDPGVAAVFGIFMTPAGFAGLDARLAPLSGGGVINFASRQDVLTAAVFVRETL